MASPLYFAVIECVPMLKVEILKTALPDEFKVMLDSDLIPSRNVTVPVGVPAPGATAVTVAVNDTVVPESAGFSDDTSAVELFALFTVWIKIADVLGAKLASPLYDAVSE